ncbi:MAG: FG-GAP and VCBS repeat-containing protein [Phycisphaeraceae bacterium]
MARVSIKPVHFAALLVAMLSGPAAKAEEYKVRTFTKIHITDKFYSEGAYYGDFNKDGKMDVVSGPFWYEGPEFKKSHEIYPVKAFDPHGYSENFVCYTHDFNGDGWTDVLVLGFPGKESYWYENPQGKEGHWKRHVAVKVTDNESPTFGDLTGDGKSEIIFHTGGVLGWAEPNWKDATQPFTVRGLSPKGGWQRFTHGYGFGDVNGDGRMDILEKDGWWEQPASLEGDPQWKRHVRPFGQGGAQMYAYDVDGDGDNDVITSLQAHNFGLSWFENTGKSDKGEINFKEHRIMGSKPEENKYGVKFSQLHAVDLVDMDGDGVKDIITGKRYWAHGPKGDAEPDAPAVVYWFKTVRSGTPGTPGKAGEVDFIPYLIDDNSGVGTQVAAADVNGDGLPDIVVGNKKGTFVHLQSVKEVTKAEWEAAQPKAIK